MEDYTFNRLSDLASLLDVQEGETIKVSMTGQRIQCHQQKIQPTGAYHLETGYFLTSIVLLIAVLIATVKHKCRTNNGNETTKQTALTTLPNDLTVKPISSSTRQSSINNNKCHPSNKILLSATLQKLTNITRDVAIGKCRWPWNTKVSCNSSTTVPQLAKENLTEPSAILIQKNHVTQMTTTTTTESLDTNNDTVPELVSSELTVKPTSDLVSIGVQQRATHMAELVHLYIAAFKEKSVELQGEVDPTCLSQMAVQHILSLERECCDTWREHRGYKYDAMQRQIDRTCQEQRHQESIKIAQENSDWMNAIIAARDSCNRCILVCLNYALASPLVGSLLVKVVGVGRQGVIRWVDDNWSKLVDGIGLDEYCRVSANKQSWSFALQGASAWIPTVASSVCWFPRLTSCVGWTMAFLFVSNLLWILSKTPELVQRVVVTLMVGIICFWYSTAYAVHWLLLSSIMALLGLWYMWKSFAAHKLKLASAPTSVRVNETVAWFDSWKPTIVMYPLLVLAISMATSAYQSM